MAESSGVARQALQSVTSPCDGTVLRLPTFGAGEIIKQGEEGKPVAEICREAGISQATYFNWRKKYAGLMPSESCHQSRHRSERRWRRACASSKMRMAA